jgi:hypothetical protein
MSAQGPRVKAHCARKCTVRAGYSGTSLGPLHPAIGGEEKKMTAGGSAGSVLVGKPNFQQTSMACLSMVSALMAEILMY